MANSNPWRREYFRDADQKFVQKYMFDASFSELEDNYDIDIVSKRTGLRAAPSIVSVKIYSDNKEMIRCGSGFIVECNTSEDGCGFKCIILTSTTLLRTDHAQNSLLDNFKVLIVVANEKEYQGDVVAHDFHYNLAAIAIKVDHPLQVAKVRCLDDLPALDFQLRPHSDQFKLVNGTQVLALGRSCDDESGLMVAPGSYSVEQCEFDCKELLRSTCRITKCGIGGPVVNLNAEVIGVNFFAIRFTPFLPINVASKWWTHFKKNREDCRPWIGAEISNLNSGIVVDEITPNSPADSAKVLVGDIVVEFDGKVVRSVLQFYDLIWDNVGKSMKLVAMRGTSNSRVELFITIGNIKDDQFNHWPLPGGDAFLFPN